MHLIIQIMHCIFLYRRCIRVGPAITKSRRSAHRESRQSERERGGEQIIPENFNHETHFEVYPTAMRKPQFVSTKLVKGSEQQNQVQPGIGNIASIGCYLWLNHGWTRFTRAVYK